MGKLDVQRVLVKNENIGPDVRWLMAFPVRELHSPFIKDVLLVSLDIPHNSAPHLCFTALFASTCVLNTLPFSISPCPVIGTTTSSFGQDYALGMILSS
jgi:hypothetical protein